MVKDNKMRIMRVVADIDKVSAAQRIQGFGSITVKVP